MFFRTMGLAIGAIVVIVAFGASTAGAARRDRTPPTTPTNLWVIATTDTTVTLAWNPSTDNSGNFSYRVTGRGINEFTTAVPQTQTTLTFRWLWPERTYSYFVYAVDAAGNRSGNSNTVTHTVPADTTPPDAGSAADRVPLQPGAGRLLLDAIGRQQPDHCPMPVAS
jgi:hypothetical protein